VLADAGHLNPHIGRTGVGQFTTLTMCPLLLGKISFDLPYLTARGLPWPLSKQTLCQSHIEEGRHERV
jgi:hypothetical protein